MSTSNKRNIIYIDILRILSIFVAIFAHTSEDGYFLFAKYANNSMHFWFYLFIAIGCRFCIPVFFGISGILLLGKEESLKKLWTKRIIPMFLIFIVISFLYYIEYLLRSTDGIQAFSLHDFLITFYCGVHKAQLWYLGEYIIFLICIPFLRALVKSLEAKYYYYLLAIAVIFKLLPIIEYILWNGNYTLYYQFKPTWLLSNVVLFPLTGYFLHNYVNNTQIKKILAPTWILYFVVTVLSCYATYILGINLGQYSEATSQYFFDNTTIVSAFVVFITFKYLCSFTNFRPVISSFISLLGKLTFGTYLLHFFLLDINFIRNILYKFQAGAINDLFASLVYSFIILILSYLSSYIISKIPFIKKIIGF